MRGAVLGLLGFIYAPVDVVCSACKGAGFVWGWSGDRGRPYESVPFTCRDCNGTHKVKVWRWLWRPWA